jgi:hypothetical protein
MHAGTHERSSSLPLDHPIIERFILAIVIVVSILLSGNLGGGLVSNFISDRVLGIGLDFVLSFFEFNTDFWRFNKLFRYAL